VTFRDPEFEKQSYRPIASWLPVLQNQTIQINGNFGTKFCGVLCAVHVTYLALFPSQFRGQILVNLWGSKIVWQFSLNANVSRIYQNDTISAALPYYFQYLTISWTRFSNNMPLLKVGSYVPKKNRIDS
jgi:hypothetical protein